MNLNISTFHQYLTKFWSDPVNHISIILGVLGVSSHRVEVAEAGRIRGKTQTDTVDVHEAASHTVTCTDRQDTEHQL